LRTQEYKEDIDMLNIIKIRLRSLFRKSAMDQELDAELLDHLERQTEQNLRLGMSPEKARQAARRAFGGVQQAKEQSREIHALRWLEELGQDLRFGARGLIRNPSFTMIAVLTLGLGLGATAAIFSVINGVFLKPLPYRDPQRLVIVWGTRPNFLEFPVMAGNFVELRDQNNSFEYIAALQPRSFNLTQSGDPETIGGLQASASLFTLLGVDTIIGRRFLPEEEQSGASRVTILSYSLWQRRFGTDPKIIGQTITLNNESYTVVGVAPRGFQFPRKGDMPNGWPFPEEVLLYTPLALTPEQISNRRGTSLAAIARIKPQHTLEQAQTELNNIAERLRRQFPEANRNTGLRVVGLHDQVISRVRRALLVLQGAVGFVLLIACANASNLLLVRASARQKEIGIRAALGASRGRIIRQLLTESALLALLGGGLALLTSFWSVSLLRKLAPENLPRADQINIDGQVLLFLLLISLLVGLLFGLVPALQSSKIDLNTTLKESGRSSAGPAAHRFRKVLVVSEVSLALTLLIGAGLMMRSFLRLMNVDPGIETQNVLTMDLRLPRSKYQPTQQIDFLQQLLDRLNGLPGIEAAATVYPLPLSGSEDTIGFSIEGRPAPSPGESLTAGPRCVSAGYFRALQIQLKRGRIFTDGDARSTPPVVVINEAMAREYWPNQDPIGRRISFDQLDGRARWREIVGVVGDIRRLGLDRDLRQEIYFPFTQSPVPPSTLVIRSHADRQSALIAIRSEIQKLDQDQPVSNIRAMDDFLEKSVSERRFNLLLLGIFAGVALALSVVGIYGVTSSLVTQRTHEIGIRRALGAQTNDILRLIIKQGMVLTITGVALGFLAAIGLTRLIANQLFGVSPMDPLTFFSFAALLLIVALAACWIPARRATKVDPIIALRLE
jgi:predicted permease